MISFRDFLFELAAEKNMTVCMMCNRAKIYYQPFYRHDRREWHTVQFKTFLKLAASLQMKPWQLLKKWERAK